MLADLLHALRALRRAPGYVAAAVLCLGLGLGVNTTVYSLMHALVFRPLPYRDPGALVAVAHGHAGMGLSQNEITLGAVLDVRERSRTVAGVAAYHARRVNVAGGDRPEALDAAVVSAGFHDLLGVRPVAGRTFRPDDSRPGAPRVLLLGETLWRTRWGARADAVGARVVLDGEPATIVGVAPDHVGLTGDREALWLPLVERREGESARGDHFLRAVARLRPGVTVAAARAELAAIGARLAEEHPATDRGWHLETLPLRESVVPPDVARVFGVMLGAVSFVLLIACANVANLLLARTAGRTRELAVRLALGAGRRRVLRLLLLESVLVALAGGALGLGVAALGLRLLVASIPVDYPSWLVFTLDARVLAYAAVLALATGLVFGLAPALRATRAALAPALRDGARGSTAGTSGRRLRDGLVVAELALSLVLMAGAGLTIRSVLGLQAVDPGFDPRGTIAGTVLLNASRHAAPEARARLLRTLVARLGALPGVEAVAAVSTPPLSGANSSAGFTIEGRPAREDERRQAETRGVLPGYFAALRIAFVAGRDLTAAEASDPAARVLVVNETMARRWWPDGNALGRRVSFGGEGESQWFTIVGVVRDVRQRSLARPPMEQVYGPEAALGWGQATLVVRATPDAGDPAALAPAMRRTLAALDPALPFADLSTMGALVARSLWQQKLLVALFSTFAAVALALAVVGVYGVIAYGVAQRIPELGVRVALGAAPGDVYRLVVGDGARLAGAGLALGLVLALATTRLLAASLHGVSPTDPLVLGGVMAALGAAALAACWLPARRAVRVDPLVALRAD